MGRKIKPFAATHYVKRGSGEIVYIKEGMFSWMYWCDIWFDWYRYDGSSGNPIKL